MLATTPIEPFKRWFFEGTHTDAVGPHAKGTLASQPSIAFTAGPRRKPVDAPLGHHPVLVTIALLFVLGAVFMRGFGEVIGVAVIIVAVSCFRNVHSACRASKPASR